MLTDKIIKYAKATAPIEKITEIAVITNHAKGVNVV
jgi:hypothetical protein